MRVWFMLSGFQSRSAMQDMSICFHGNVLFYPSLLFFFLCRIHINATLESVGYDGQIEGSIFHEVFKEM